MGHQALKPKLRKTKHGDYEKILSFPMYSDYKVHIVFANSILEARVKRYGDPGKAADPNNEAITMHSIDGHCHIIMPIKSSARVLAHETFHAVFSMFSHLGIGFDNEGYAYPVGYIVGEISDFQRKVLKSEGIN